MEFGFYQGGSAIFPWKDILHTRAKEQDQAIKWADERKATLKEDKARMAENLKIESEKLAYRHNMWAHQENQKKLKAYMQIRQSGLTLEEAQADPRWAHIAADILTPISSNPIYQQGIIQRQYQIEAEKMKQNPETAGLIDENSYAEMMGFANSYDGSQNAEDYIARGTSVYSSFNLAKEIKATYGHTQPYIKRKTTNADGSSYEYTMIDAEKVSSSVLEFINHSQQAGAKNWRREKDAIFVNAFGDSDKVKSDPSVLIDNAMYGAEVFNQEYLQIKKKYEDPKGGPMSEENEIKLLDEWQSKWKQIVESDPQAVYEQFYKLYVAKEALKMAPPEKDEIAEAAESVEFMLIPLRNAYKKKGKGSGGESANVTQRALIRSAFEEYDRMVGDWNKAESYQGFVNEHTTQGANVGTLANTPVSFLSSGETYDLEVGDQKLQKTKVKMKDYNINNHLYDASGKKTGANPDEIHVLASVTTQGIATWAPTPSVMNKKPFIVGDKKTLDAVNDPSKVYIVMTGVQQTASQFHDKFLKVGPNNTGYFLNEPALITPAEKQIAQKMTIKFHDGNAWKTTSFWDFMRGSGSVSTKAVLPVKIYSTKDVTSKHIDKSILEGYLAQDPEFADQWLDDETDMDKESMQAFKKAASETKYRLAFYSPALETIGSQQTAQNPERFVDVDGRATGNRW